MHGWERLLLQLLGLGLEAEAFHQAGGGRGGGLRAAATVQEDHTQHTVQHSQTQVGVVYGQDWRMLETLEGKWFQIKIRRLWCHLLFKKDHSFWLYCNKSHVAHIHTYLWSSQRRCTSTLSWRSVSGHLLLGWRATGFLRSCSSSVSGCSPERVSSARAHRSYRSQAYTTGPPVANTS